MSAETSTKFSKLRKKVKLATGVPRKAKDSANIVDFKKKSTRDNGKRLDDAVDVYYEDGKLYKRGSSERRNVNWKTEKRKTRPVQDGYVEEVQGNSGFKSTSSNQSRKRVYADHDKGREEVVRKNVKTPNSKPLFKRSKARDDVVEVNQNVKGQSREFERPKSRGFNVEGKNCRKNELVDRDGGRKLTTKTKDFNKMEAVDGDGGRNRLLKKDVKSKSNSSKQHDQIKNGYAVESLEKVAKKNYWGRKSLDEDSAKRDDQPKKTKRVIRIDRRDISNKRLDDGISTSENIKDKKEDLTKNENVEMSQNAQFRAIQPSPSILSFVEDNLLGRRRLIELRRAGYNIELSAPLDNIPIPTSSERKPLRNAPLFPSSERKSLDNIPLSSSSERERVEESLFRNKLTFSAAAKIASSFPPPDLPEIAFAGRSNVGKSSLLNALTRQWGVVRTSDKPGLTQTINFFDLGSKLCLVDLPGYGFAYAKEEVKEAWEDLVKEYVSTRVGLKQVCLLIDTKWGMKPRDHELVHLMERSQTKYQIVLTKTDLVFPIDVARRAMQIEESLKANKSAVAPVMMVSSKNGAGIGALRTVLAKIARFTKI